MVEFTYSTKRPGASSQDSSGPISLKEPHKKTRHTIERAEKEPAANAIKVMDAPFAKV
jgi:hypothetical protein